MTRRTVARSVLRTSLLLVLYVVPGVAHRNVVVGQTASRAATDARPFGPRDVVELERLVDSVVRAEMTKQHVPGAAFVFVQDGRIVLSKGYGVANIATSQPVDPARTIWRIGSISKVFTADAVMLLAERGKISLDADVNQYLRSVRAPQAFGRPVTAAHLLTHIAGFDEIRPGTQAGDAASVLSLSAFLTPRLTPISPPGETFSYSSYGMTLAGALVEDVSGQPFERFLRDNIWKPLGMERTSITVPGALRGDVAIGYEWVGGASQPQAWEWYHTTPASSVNSTATEMGRWLLMHLERGRLDNAVVMRKETVEQMFAQHVTGHPKIAGYSYGWNENVEPGYVRFLDHGGKMAGFSAEALIVPERRAGFFLVHHGENANIGDPIKWAIVDRFYQDSLKRLPRPQFPATPVLLSRFAGRFGWNTFCHTCPGARPGVVFTSVANADGSLTINGRKWIEVEPLLFVRDDGKSRLAFRADSAGKITHMFFGGYWVLERLP